MGIFEKENRRLICFDKLAQAMQKTVADEAVYGECHSINLDWQAQDCERDRCRQDYDRPDNVGYGVRDSLLNHGKKNGEPE